MKTLELVLKKKWFDMILSGEKKEEYRDWTGYWINRLTNGSGVSKDFDYIRFRHGYSKNAPEFTIKCHGIELGEANPNWTDAHVPTWYGFKIFLGKITETKNITHDPHI